MKKTLIFAALAIVLLAAGCSKKASLETNSSVSVQPTPTPEENGQTSMKELMLSGKSQKCEVAYLQNNVQSSGTVYLANGKMRGDFTAEVNGKTENTHMITDSQNVYTWVEGMGNGFKMSAQATDKTQASSTKHSTIDQNAKYNFKCSGWSADDSKFKIPSNITFSDLNSLMLQEQNSTGPTGTNSNSYLKANSSASLKLQQCGACDSAGAGKAQCRAALGC